MKKGIKKHFLATFIHALGKVDFYYTKFPRIDKDYPGFLYHVDFTDSVLTNIYAGTNYQIARSHFYGLTLDRL